jgi:hypothetical protein
MKEQKNIDRLFQEKFKDFEEHPPALVWNQIEKRLPTNESKKRVIPIFWKIGGVAASLILVGFLYFLTTNNQTSIPNIEVVNSDDSDATKEEKGNTETNNPIQIDANPAQDYFIQNETQITEQEQKNKSKNIQDIEKTSLVQTENNIRNQNQTTEKGLVQKKQSSSFLNEKVDAQNNGVVQNSNDSKINPNKSILDKKVVQNNVAIIDSSTTIKNGALRLASQNTELTITKKSNTQNIDSLFVSEIEVAAVEETKNPLEELLKEKEQQQKTNPNSEIDRWQIASSVAPVYFNSLAGGSTIDAQFAENQKTTETQMSYGLGVQYAVNKKISVRTGINKLNLGYNTNGIEFMPTLNGQILSNVEPNNFGQTFMMQNVSGVTAFIENPIQTRDQGYLNQRLGYLEIPLEIKYRLIDKKIGFTLIGGMSSMILTDNQINAVSSSFNTNLGEASNVNSFSFSTNLGVGLEYRFFKSFQANFEPMLKYQMNTFSNNTSGFKPYFFGLYSGISYRV